MVAAGKIYDLIVIGGGVAGLMAAGTAASENPEAAVLLLEKMEKPARKLRITGKGRCNLTNDKPEDEFLEKVKQGRDFFRSAFERFDNREVVRLFERLGVPLTVERGGRVFPTSGKAWDIAEAMVGWVKERGVEVRCHAPVEALWTGGQEIRGVVLENGDRITGRQVVLATGGVSYPATGSTGDGHRMAMDDAGHGIEPLRPALVPLEVDIPDKGLKGLLLKNISLSLWVDGREVDRRFGEVEFTDDRVLGGAVTLQLSREAVDAVLDGKRVELEIDLKPALTREQLLRRMAREREKLEKGGSVLRKLLPGKLVGVIARLTAGNDERVADVLKGWRFGVADYRPFTEAIVTAGGVVLSEVDPRTMESRKIQGLYFAGELLDIDADTGGYNIQVALSTGYVAGLSAVKTRCEF